MKKKREIIDHNERSYRPNENYYYERSKPNFRPNYDIHEHSRPEKHAYIPTYHKHREPDRYKAEKSELGQNFDPNKKINKNSSWYYESMQTINDLKNFRDNVRTKLNLTVATPSRVNSKYSTPRYGIY